MTKDVRFPSKDSLLHFIAENDLVQFAVLKHSDDDFELAYVTEMEEQPVTE